MNICLCGAQAGYPHATDCPYPLYRNSAALNTAWVEERSRIREALAEQAASDPVQPMKETHGNLLCGPIPGEVL